MRCQLITASLAVHLALSVLGWNGPQASVTNRSGSPALTVDSKLLPAVWFVGNPCDTCNLTNFYVQQQAASRAGFHIVEPILSQWQLNRGYSDGLDPHTKLVLDGIVTNDIDAMFILRLFINPTVEPVLMQCAANASITQNVTAHPGWMGDSPASPDWIAKASSGLIPFLIQVDALYPGRVVGVHLTGMSSGEWSWPGAASTGEPANASATCSGSTPAGAVNFFSDYSVSMRIRHCAGRPADCRLPSAQERNTPRTGSNRSTGPADAVVEANRLQSIVMAEAISGLATAVKQATSQKLLVLAFYGYSLHCTTGRKGSNSRNLVNFGHMAGVRLLENPAIDGFVGPYSYAPTTRNFSRPLLPAGEFSSLWLRQRLWVVEDDSRTHLAAGDPVYGGHPLKFCFSLRDTVDLLRRNLLTAMFQQHSAYMFDLQNQGWFGQKARMADTVAIWSSLATAYKLGTKLSHVNGPLPSAQIALFFDESSPSVQPLDSRGPQSGGSHSIAGDFTLINSSLEIASIGAPYNHFYLSDLESIDIRPFRMAVFLNAFAPSQQLRDAIHRKFADSQITLVFLGPAGVVFADTAPCFTNYSGVSEFTGIRGLQAVAPTNATTTVITEDALKVEALFPNISSLIGATFGSPEPFSPRMQLVGSSDDVFVLGRYSDTGAPSLVGAKSSGVVRIFSGSPSLPADLWKAIAVGAGVHIYSDCSHQHDCDVAAAKNGVLVHAGSRQGNRSIAFPRPLVVEDEVGNVLCDRNAPCSEVTTWLRSGESRVLFVNDGFDTHVDT